jgi:hypothetical protein
MMKKFLGLILMVVGLASTGWGASIPSVSTTTIIQSSMTVVHSTGAVVQSTASVVRSTTSVMHTPPAPPPTLYVCPYNKPICPYVGCYGSHNWVGCSLVEIMTKTKQVKVANLNDGKEEVVDRHQIRQLSRFSRVPDRDTAVLLDCATPHMNCPATDQHHYVSCTIINALIPDHIATIACGDLIDLFMPLSDLYTAKPVVSFQDIPEDVRPIK